MSVSLECNVGKWYIGVYGRAGMVFFGGATVDGPV